jgi:TRAP-type transport system periplasmic protein
MTTGLTRRGLMASMGAALALPAFVKRAHAAEVTLRLSHMLPAMAPIQTALFEPWAKEIAEASDGRIEIQIFPALQLGGKPPQQADQVKGGIADIAWTLPVYTPDRFMVAETMSLPFMVTDASRSSVAMHKLMETYGADDYTGIKPLAFHTHAGGKLHMRDNPILTAADLKGARIRSPNQSMGELLTSLGADPVFFPVTDMIVGLSNGVIDGCCLPYEVVPAFKLQELTHHSSAPAPATRGLYSNTFALLMNQERYESMPDDLRAVIDAASGAALSARMGASFDKFEEMGKEVVVKQGNEIHEIAATEIDAWRPLAEPIHAAWQKKLDDSGHDGAAIMKLANDLLDMV